MPIELVAFDMDGTLVDVESSWKEVHEHFGESNSEALELFLADRIDDREFIRRDIELWWKHDPRIDLATIDRILDEVPIIPGADRLFGELHRRKIATAIISGGIDRLADRIARRLKIPYVYANGFEVDAAGRLTGGAVVRVPIKRKGEALAHLQQRLHVGPGATAAVGNSDIDVAMFDRSRVGIAFLPADDHVRSRATAIVTEHDLSECLPYLIED